MNRALRSFLFAILAFAAGTWLLCKPRQRPGPTPIASAPAASAPAAPSGTGTTARGRAPNLSPPPGAPVTSGRGFRTRDRLEEHFAKHGAEFQAASVQAYLALAQALRDAPVDSNVLEIVRPSDGVVSRFDKRTGAFGAFDRDGTIRTFFKPNDGEAYFRRQARRSPRS